MTQSALIIYEPLDRFLEKRDYWNNYITFYEKYWGGPTSPYGVWFGKEYEFFREALSNYLGIDDQEIEDCFFMKDKEDRYYISPLARVNPYLLCSENYIPLEWFVLFNDDEREFFHTPWGFAGMHYDTKIGLCLRRIEETNNILKKVSTDHKEGGLNLTLFQKLNEIQARIVDLENWLSGFDSSSYVLLNYGEICSFIHPYTLKNERSVKDIWQLLSFVGEGKFDEAQGVLNLLTERWEDIRKKASGDVSSFSIQ
ncbi:MAG TPA: hypothetical protein VH878_04125 [Thermodesulfobacteriota bacterium]